jgi:hypothetical protein
MLGSNSYEFNSTMECRDRDDESVGGGGYNNINLLRNGRGKCTSLFASLENRSWNSCWVIFLAKSKHWTFTMGDLFVVSFRLGHNEWIRITLETNCTDYRRRQCFNVFMSSFDSWNCFLSNKFYWSSFRRFSSFSLKHKRRTLHSLLAQALQFMMEHTQRDNK